MHDRTNAGETSTGRWEEGAMIGGRMTPLTRWRTLLMVFIGILLSGLAASKQLRYDKSQVDMEGSEVDRESAMWESRLLRI